MSYYETRDPAALLPWKWTIVPKDPSITTGSPPSHILGTYAAVNIVVSVLGILSGYRPFVHRLTCKLLGKKDSKSWKFMWIIPVGLQLCANALVALIILRDPSRLSSFAIGELILLLVTRPRLSFAFLGGLTFVHNLDEETSPGRGPQTRLLEEEFCWLSAALTQFLAELSLQLLTLYIMGKTVHFATKNGYYKIWTKEYKDLPVSAHLMYGGAMYYLVMGSQGILLQIGCFTKPEEDEEVGEEETLFEPFDIDKKESARVFLYYLR
jgi:hypothetical protein